MKGTGRFAIIFAVTLLILGGVIKLTQKGDSKPIRCYSQKNQFSMEFPANWKIRKESQTETMMAMSTSNGIRRSVSVYVKKLSEGLTAEQWIEEWFSQHKEHERGQITIGNRYAKWRRITIRTDWRKEPIDVMSTHYYLVRGQRIYVIDCSAIPPSVFDQCKGEFEKIVKTFRFE
jgi:hypothetical protein